MKLTNNQNEKCYEKKAKPGQETRGPGGTGLDRTVTEGLAEW